MDGISIVAVVLVCIIGYLSILLWNFTHSKPQNSPQCKECGKNSWTEVQDGKRLYQCENCGHPERFKPEEVVKSEE